MTKTEVILKILEGLVEEGIMAELEGRKPSIENNTKKVFKIIDESDLNEEDKEELKQVQRDFIKDIKDQEEKQKEALDDLRGFVVDLEIMDYAESCKDKDNMSIADFMMGVYKIIDNSDLSEQAKKEKKLEEAMIGYEIIKDML